MDVNNLLVVCVVFLSFGLSTQFLIGDIFGFGKPLLQCFGNTCDNQDNDGSQNHHHHHRCEIGHNNGIYTGHCHTYEHFDFDKSCGNHKPTCYCYDQLCIDGFVEKNRQYLELKQMTYTCLTHTCDGTQYCHIHKKDDKIVSTCNHHEPPSEPMCLDHDSVTSSRGCYCRTADCVQKTAIHCLGVNCNPTEGCRIDLHGDQLQARCYTLHECDDENPCLRRCNVPLSFGHGHLSCRCDSQDCADKLQAPTTNTPSTTTVPALLQPDPYACVIENCDKHQPYCNLYLDNNNIIGRCMIFKAGQFCTPSNDLSVNAGCYCSDSKCVIDATTDYNQKHITVPTLGPEYLCDKASCRSNMFCQLYTYQGVAAGRCLPFNTGNNCLSYTDVDEMGCICNNAYCASTILAEYVSKNPDSTTTSTTPESTTPPPTSTPTATTPSTTTPSTTTPTTTTLTTTTLTTTTTIPTTTSPTTTQTTTTSTITPPTTPTKTTPTTTIPTTTTITTATTVQAVVNSGPRTCHICGDTSLPVPCSSRQIGRDLSHTCKTGENYCMTDIVQDDQGNVDVFKRCVDLATCEKKWITESADLDYCKRYGVVKNPYAFSCHFCCTENKCNSMLVPNTTTWYTKTN